MTLSISLFALYMLSPILFRLHDHLLIQQEADNLQSFLFQLQSEARFNQWNYALTLAQHAQGWCVIGLVKNSEKLPTCHCLNLPECASNTAYRVYHNQTSTSLYANRLYPTVFTHIDGISGNSSGGCLNLSKGEEKRILQLQQAGVVNVVQHKSRSRC